MRFLCRIGWHKWCHSAVIKMPWITDTMTCKRCGLSFSYTSDVPPAIRRAIASRN